MACLFFYWIKYVYVERDVKDMRGYSPLSQNMGEKHYINNNNQTLYRINPNFNNIKHLFMAFCVGCSTVALTAACSDWDDHYENEAANSSDPCKQNVIGSDQYKLRPFGRNGGKGYRMDTDIRREQSGGL